MGKPKIVILEGYTTNPGDLSWDVFAKLGELTVYERTAPSEIAERAGGAQIVVSNKIIWDAQSLAAIPECTLIQLLSTGYNVVDYDVAATRGLTVCNVPAYSTPDVVQHTFALIFETTNHVSDYAASVREGKWAGASDFTYYVDPVTEIAGKTLGIVGMGSIGSGVARVALAFGMEVLFANPSPKPQHENAHCHQVSLDCLLAQSDIVSLHCPATPENTGLVDEAFLAKMKAGSRLINTARGALLNSAAIAEALHSGHLAAFASDVAEKEPMSASDPLRTAPRATITPHIAWAATEARARLIARAAANVEAYLAGKPINVVSRGGRA